MIHIVPRNIEGRERLRLYLRGIFPLLETNASVKKAIKRGYITINGKVADSGCFVQSGDRISYSPFDQKVYRDLPVVEMVYEDADMVVVYKPPGLLSSGNARDTLQNRLKNWYSECDGDLSFPLLVHRLDYSTDGLVIAAKTMEMRRLLGKDIGGNKIKKTYLALVEGRFWTGKRFIEYSIDGKAARTEILSVSYPDLRDEISLLLVRIHSGRRHQIRRHCEKVGHPIVGDMLYNIGGLSFKKGLMLSAVSLEMVQPISGEKIYIKGKLHKKWRHILGNEWDILAKAINL